MTLTIGIALGAGVLIVVMLGVAFIVPPIDDESTVKANRRTPSPHSPRRHVTIRRSGKIPALEEAPARLRTHETRTTPAEKPAQRPARRGIAEPTTAWPRKLSHERQHFRAWRRRRALGAAQAGWVGAGVVALVAIGYLIAHI